MKTSSAKKFGCIGCICFFFLFIISIFVLTFHCEEYLYYIENEEMYVMYKRNSGGTMASVFVGKSMEDIDNKLDYFQIDRTKWDSHSVTIIKEKSSDTIFISVPSEDYVDIKSSVHYQISSLIPPIEEVRSYGLDGSEHTSRVVDHTYDKRFKENAGNYTTIMYLGWDRFWHEKNTLLVVDEYSSGRIDWDRVKQFEPINR